MQKVNFPKNYNQNMIYLKYQKNRIVMSSMKKPPKINRLNKPDYKFSLGEIIDNKVVDKLKSEIACVKE